VNNKKGLLDFISENRVVHIILSIILGFLVGAIFLVILNISVSAAYGRLFAPFTTLKGITYIIVYAIPYIMTGLSVAFSFKTGVFNIGCEGQFVVGSITASCIGIFCANLPSIILIPMCFIGAMLAGALWGIIVGVLKIKWGINEVLSMIMFNWIAFYLSNFIVKLPAVHSDGTAEATKNISENAQTLFSDEIIAKFGLCPTANWGILVAIIMAVVVWFIIEKTTLGYELKAVGFNKDAALYGGINVNRSILLALAISGAMAGLGGALQVMGMGKRISLFSSQEGFGFAGIVTALIGCSNPFGVIAAGLFYGLLMYGGSKLNLVGAPTQLVSVIVGTVVFFIAISIVFQNIKEIKKLFNRKKDAQGKGGNA